MRNNVNIPLECMCPWVLNVERENRLYNEDNQLMDRVHCSLDLLMIDVRMPE